MNNESEKITSHSLDQILIMLLDKRGVVPSKLNSDWMEEGNLVISADDSNSDGSISFDRSKFIDDSTFERWMGSSTLQNGDILLTSEGGSFARVSRIRVDSVEKIALGQRLFALRTDPELCDQSFLYHWLRSYEGQYAIKSRGTGLIEGIRQSELKKILIKIPTNGVDQKIGHNLDLFDELLHVQRRQMGISEEMISALFRSWFIDFDPVKVKAEGRLPYGMDEETAELFPDSFEDSKYGKIPAGWDYVFLEDLATLTKKTLNPKRKPEEKFFHYSIPAYDNGANPILTLGDDIESNKFVVPDNCVLLSKLNPKWNRVWIPELSSDYVGIASTEFLPWVPKNGVSVYYLHSLMVSQPFRWLMDSRISGTTGSHQRVRPDDCAKIPCLMPSVDVMKKFHDAVEKMNGQIKNLAKTHLDLVACRDVLLPRLMSGELSVS